MYSYNWWAWTSVDSRGREHEVVSTAAVILYLYTIIIALSAQFTFFA